MTSVEIDQSPASDTFEAVFRNKGGTVRKEPPPVIMPLDLHAPLEVASERAHLRVLTSRDRLLEDKVSEAFRDFKDVFLLIDGRHADVFIVSEDRSDEVYMTALEAEESVRHMFAGWTLDVHVKLARGRAPATCVPQGVKRLRG